MKTLMLFFILGCYPIYSLQAQTDIGKIISGTYTCAGTVVRFVKEGESDKVTEDKKAIVTIKDLGGNKVRVSMSGAKSTYELQVVGDGPSSIGGENIINGILANSVRLYLNDKPASISGKNGENGVSKENVEMWWFEGTANENKPESLPPTCIEIWDILTSESFDVGGNFGLLDSTTSMATAWDRLKNGRDAKYNGTLITDGVKNVFYKYMPSSAQTFKEKGYTIVGGIQISSGPNSPAKIRFTN